MDKELYSFDVDTVKEVEVTEEKVVDGETVSVTKKVEETVPVKLVIKKPTRRFIDEAEMHRAVKMSECIKKGILTKAMLTKKYADTGGILSELDAKAHLARYNKLSELNIEWARLTVTKKKEDGDEDRLKKVVSEMNRLRSNIAEVESDHSSLYNNTSDVLSLKAEILYYTLMLSYSQDDESGDGNEDPTLKPFFEGDTYEEKLEDYYKNEDDPSDFYIKTITKFSYFVSFWRNGAAITREDFEDLEKDIDEGKL